MISIDSPAGSESHLGTAHVVTEPFHYAVFPELDGFQAALNGALGWLEQGAVWRRTRTSFYDQHELSLRPDAVPEGASGVLSEPFFRRLLRTMESAFGCAFHPLLKIGAHKLVPGQGVGLHTDRQVALGESHRFVLQLNRGWRDDYGGHLILFNSQSVEDPHRIIRPLHGSATAFRCAPNSYHAVCPVVDGVRFSLVFSFWAKEDGQPPAYLGAVRAEEPGYCFSTPGDGPPSGEAASHRKAADLLAAVGASAVDHCGTTLLNHLYGTYELLVRWGAPSDVQLAGLLHSIYGTAGFDVASVPLADRGLVREAVGAKAERLIYLHCCAAPDAVLHCLSAAGADRSLTNRMGGAPKRVTASEIRDLAILELANVIDIMNGDPRARQKLLASGIRLLDRAAPRLPAAVVEACRAAFGRT